MALLALAIWAPAEAQPGPVGEVFNAEIEAREDDRGFARLVLTFPKPIQFERTIANGVLVLGLEDPVDVDLSGISFSVPSYIVAARSDPGGKSIRFALAQRLTVSVLPAAERLFVDLLPESWTGPPPGLPAEVIAELEERAKEAERRKKRGGARAFASGVPLMLRVGRYPTFSRIVFEWNDVVNTTLSRSGSTVRLQFDRSGDVDLTRLNVDPPPNVRGADIAVEEGQTEVRIDVAIGADVRGFREDTSYVLDVSSDDGLGLDRVEQIDQGQVSPALPPVPNGAEEMRMSGMEAALAPVEPAMSGPEALPMAPADSPAASVPNPADVLPPGMPTGDLEITVTPLDLGRDATSPSDPIPPIPTAPAPVADAAPIAADPVEGPIEVATPQSPDDGEELVELPAAGPPETAPMVAPPPIDPPDAIAMAPEEEAPPVEVPVTSAPAAVAEPMPPMTPPASETPAPIMGVSSKPAMPESIFQPDEKRISDAAARSQAPGARIVDARKVGETLRITFPFEDKVAGALFQRANTLWMVFDTDMVLDVEAIREAGKDRIEEVSVVRSGAMQIIRAKLRRRYLATALPGKRDWIVSIGDQVLDPTTPVVLERALRTDGRSKVVAQLSDNGQVHWISDAEIGDQIAIVTAHGPARGLIKRQEFVEFVGLPTAHGLAIQPIADDLAVRIAHTEIVITRDSGLTVTSATLPLFTPDRRGAGDTTRPGLIKFDDWSQGGPEAFRANISRLHTQLAELEPEQRAPVRLELARLLLAHEMGAEALGVMRLAVEDDPAIENDAVFRAMRGVANLFVNHLKAAQADLSTAALTTDPHSALWRGVIAAKQGRWRDAQLALDDGQTALDAYPPARQARFRLAGARAALMVNDIATATGHLDALPERELSGEDRQTVTLLRGLLAAASGDRDQALKRYADVDAGRWGPAAAEARYRRVSLAESSGRMPTDEAIDLLETLALTWRGDDIELEVLNKLAHLHVAQGNFRRGLEVMRTAVITHNGTARSDQIREEMGKIFERLFLEGGADEMNSLDALALYYEFRELTPVGRRGDEMIRRLSRRLVDVDLLAQAADLLNHQVENRLSGAARAQVATDLAYVYMMDRKPEMALRAIRRTRQAVLPKALQFKRNLLEARSLAELGQVEVAIELLDAMEGDEVSRLKADALWRGKRWAAAGRQIEDALADAWREDGEFTDQVRFEVMRSAISYALANDRTGLERIRRKFVDKMAATPDALRFDVVTKVGARNAVEFNTLAAEFAEIDTLAQFLDEFRRRHGAAGDQALEETSGIDGAGATQTQG